MLVNCMEVSTKAWLVLGGIIAGYELFSPKGQLLSHGVDRALVKHPILTRWAILVTAAHLLNLLDRHPLRWLDPYQAIGEAAGGIARG